MSSRFALVAIAGYLLVAAAAFAAPIGFLDVTNCSGGGVTVTATSLDWILPPDLGSGCVVTGTSTNITYVGGGPLTSGVTGSILDLTFPTAFPVADFLTFSGNPDLHFNLESLGPGSSSTICATLLNPNLPSCSVFAGSPIILTPTSTGTTATLSAVGIATDLSGSSIWSGQYTTQIPGMTPAAIQGVILSPGGSLTNTYSGSFVLTSVPEPAAMLLIGVGLVALGLIRRTRRVA